MEGLKIIIADDEALIRLDLREMLTEAGHTVLGEASDGEEAVELAKRLHLSPGKHPELGSRAW